MRIIHFSDPHAGGPAESWQAYFDKRVVGVFNYRFRRRYRHDLSKLKNAVKYILDTRPDVAVCTGDLTSAGQPGEFEKTLAILAPLRDSNIPFIYLPGNHDCYVKNPSCVAAVQNAMNYLNRGQITMDSLPQVLEINGVEFWLINTSRPSNLLCSWGFVDPKDIDFFADFAAKNPHSKPRILVTHYPLIEKHPWLRFRHRLYRHKRLLQMLRNHVIDVSLVGHVHYPSLKIDADGHGECCSGSVTRNGAMTEILCDPATRHFTYKTLLL